MPTCLVRVEAWREKNPLYLFAYRIWKTAGCDEQILSKIDTEDSGLHTETNNTDGYDTL
jgi:hypothetical protein